MDRYLVDTSVLIDLSRGTAGIRDRLAALAATGAELGICAVNVAEFTSSIPSSQMWRWHRLLQGFIYWDISYEAAVRAGAFRDALRRQGITLQVPDALIAAVAATVDATILSDNIRHFQLIPDVRVRSPRL